MVDIAATRTEAVDAVARKTPGLVLADIQLADGSSGIDAVKDILARYDVPVIFITAFPERLLTGERPEPTFLITKPFQPETVKAAIGQALFFHPRKARSKRPRPTQPKPRRPSRSGRFVGAEISRSSGRPLLAVRTRAASWVSLAVSRPSSSRIGPGFRCCAGAAAAADVLGRLAGLLVPGGVWMARGSGALKAVGVGGAAVVRLGRARSSDFQVQAANSASAASSVPNTSTQKTWRPQRPWRARVAPTVAGSGCDRWKPWTDSLLGREDS